MLTVTESTDTCMHTLCDLLRLGRNLKGTMKIAMNQMVWQNFCKKICAVQINERMMIGLPNWTPIPGCMHICILDTVYMLLKEDQNYYFA